MKKSRKKLKKGLLITVSILILIAGGGYLFLEHLKSELMEKISGCKLESSNFKTVIDFEYVNNWIVVQVKVDESGRLFPFIFDTGAQTVILDSLLKEINRKDFTSFGFSRAKDTALHAFNNEIITLKSLGMGDVKFSGIGAMTAKNESWGMLNCISAYGIIGYNIIQTCTFQIDYQKKQITLCDKVESLGNFNGIEWLAYKPSANQESPIIPAIINDSISIDLFFDTGMSGGIKLLSSDIYKKLCNFIPNQIRKYTSKPSILVRNKNEGLNRSLAFKASEISIGQQKLQNFKVTVSDKNEREFAGFIGNQFFENYIITLDYKNRRIGFIPVQSPSENFTTYGLGYLPFGDKMLVSTIYDGSEADNAGILPGDEIFSINGIKISDLAQDIFCGIYRQEYSFTKPGDSLLSIEIINNDSVFLFQFKKHDLF
jgi:PDZ domain